MIDQDQDQIATLRLRISGLEKDLTALNPRASEAKIALHNMRIWFERNPNHPQKGRELARLEEREQRALTDFNHISQALQRARQQLIEAEQRIEA